MDGVQERKTLPGMELALLVWVRKLQHLCGFARGAKLFRGNGAARRTAVHHVLSVIPSLWIALFAVSSAMADSAPQLDVEGMTFVASRENRDAIILHAEHAKFDTTQKKAYLREVDATVPATGAQRGFKMRCDTSVVDLETNDFEATGNVTGEADGGEYFEADWVRYDHERGVLLTEAPVLITDSGTTLLGGGFSYDIAERRFQLIGGARVVQDVTKKEGGGQ